MRRLILGLSISALHLSPAHADVATDLVVTVTPAVATPGQTVTVKLENVSASTTYTLPATCLFTSVHAQACDSDPFFVVPGCVATPVPLGPGQSITQPWNQTDDLGNQVPDGAYSFAIDVVDPSGVVSQLCPAMQVGFGCALPPQQYGLASPGTGGNAPAISSVGGFPAIGSNNFQVAVTNAVGGAQGVLFLGFAPSALSASWGTFLIDPTLPLFQIPVLFSGTPGQAGQGIAFAALPIPNDPFLLGFELFFQCLVADPGSIGGIAHSEGLRVILCQ